MKDNTVTVTSDIDDDRLWREQSVLVSWHSINADPEVGMSYEVRNRHRAPLITAKITGFNHGVAEVKFKDPTRAITPGQSLVFYDEEQVIGGGIISQ